MMPVVVLTGDVKWCHSKRGPVCSVSSYCLLLTV